MSDFWRVLRFAARHRWLAVVVVACIAVATIVDVLVFPLFAALVFGLLFPAREMPSDVPAVLRSLLSGLQAAHSASGGAALRWLLMLCVGILVSYFVRGVAVFASSYLSQFIAQRVMYTLRERIYSRLLRLSLSFHDRQTVGDLMSRMTNDVILIQHMVSIQLAEAVATGITLVVGVGLMLVISWKLTALAVVLVPVTGYCISRSGSAMRRAQTSIQERLAALSARLQERLYSVRIIQSFAREEHEDQRFAELNAQNVQANLRSARILSLLGPVVEFLGVVGMVGGIAFAGWQVTRGRLLPELLAAYLFAVQRVGQRFSKIGSIHLSIQQALSAARRIFEILDSEAAVRDAPDAVALPRAAGRVRLRRVSFAYPGGAGTVPQWTVPSAGDGPYIAPPLVLRDLDFAVEPGEVVALVGPSGAGKTTLVNLLPRFYDPVAGAVEIDGYDLRRVTLESLRAQVGIVPQETILFGGTIYDNIRYGRLDATPEQEHAAARAANAEEFIQALEAGYDFEVGERGLRLSGGQRQRIAIARALLKDPAILVLDEATSSLDMESEALVEEALERLMRGRTTFIIAHRLPTVRRADRILVLADGGIIEQGTHEELLARGERGAAGGLYRRLYQMQFRDAPAREPLGGGEVAPTQ